MTWAVTMLLVLLSLAMIRRHISRQPRRAAVAAMQA
jgi:hypothetical protein